VATATSRTPSAGKSKRVRANAGPGFYAGLSVEQLGNQLRCTHDEVVSAWAVAAIVTPAVVPILGSRPTRSLAPWVRLRAWVFTYAAAVVVDTGATMAHPAIVTRQFGIPCVVGSKDCQGCSTYRIRGRGRRHKGRVTRIA
jgi:hypothetical protein